MKCTHHSRSVHVPIPVSFAANSATTSSYKFSLYSIHNDDDVTSYAVIDLHTLRSNNRSKLSSSEVNSDVIKTNFELLSMQFFCLNFHYAVGVSFVLTSCLFVEQYLLENFVPILE